MVFVILRGPYYSSAINLIDSGWEDNFTQSYSPIAFQADFFIEKVLKLAKILSEKMSMEADETKCMVNSFMFCELFAIVSKFH